MYITNVVSAFCFLQPKSAVGIMELAKYCNITFSFSICKYMYIEALDLIISALFQPISIFNETIWIFYLDSIN